MVQPLYLLALVKKTPTPNMHVIANKRERQAILRNIYLSNFTLYCQFPFFLVFGTFHKYVSTVKLSGKTSKQTKTEQPGEWSHQEPK